VTAESTAPIAGQRSAVQLLANLIGQHAELPAAYIVVHEPWRGAPSKLLLQLPTPQAFEQWRAALDITPVNVTLHFHASDSWLAGDTVRESIALNITAHGIRLTADEFTAPRDREQVAA
jgi:hypothetical protein